MNFGAVLLGLLLIGASIFGIILIASSNQDPVVDSFGDVQSNQTNTSRATVENVTAPLMGGAGGLALLFAIFVVFSAVVMVIAAAFGSGKYNTRR